VAFNPKSPFLVVENDWIELWDVDQTSSTFGEVLTRIGNPTETPTWFFSVAFSPDGQTLAAGDCAPWGGYVYLWDFDLQSPDLTIEPVIIDQLPLCALSLEFSSDGKRLMMGNDFEMNIIVWDVDPDSPTYGQSLAAMGGHEWYVPDLSISPDGTRLASVGGRDPTVRIWDVDPASDTFGDKLGCLCSTAVWWNA
jgi:WD40 repeat protein